MLLFVPSAVAMVVEPVLFVLADRHPRRWFLSGGVALMAMAAFLAAAANGPWTMTLAVTLGYLGSGSGVALAQATLVDLQPPDVPGAAEKALSRWALLGELGDLLGPVLMGVLAAFSLGWRSGFVTVGVVCAALAVLLWRPRYPAPGTEEDEAQDGVLQRLKEGVRRPGLLRWLGAAALCDLLDDMVVVFAVMHLRDDFGMTALARSAVIGAGVVGAVLGVVVTERVAARTSARRLLGVSSVFCAVAYLAWIVTPEPWLSGLLFGLVGLFAAPMYPLTVARAYRAWPGNSGGVNAVGHLFTPLSLAAPAVLGLVADRFGLPLALGLLLLQPVGVGLLGAALGPDSGLGGGGRRGAG